jgi:hypothetical protein
MPHTTFFHGVSPSAGFCSAGSETPHEFVVRGIKPTRFYSPGYQTPQENSTIIKYITLFYKIYNSSIYIYIYATLLMCIRLQLFNISISIYISSPRILYVCMYVKSNSARHCRKLRYTPTLHLHLTILFHFYTARLGGVVVMAISYMEWSEWFKGTVSPGIYFFLWS